MSHGLILGGALRHITCNDDDTLYTVCLNNNTIKVIRASSLEPACIVKGIQYEDSLALRKAFPCGLQTDPR
jgi:hypothetical protein